jgi:hypothetical protein
MRKSKNRVRLQVEAMEPMALLSALAPGLSVPVRNTVVAEVESNTEPLARQSISSVNIQNKTGVVLDVKATLKVSMGRQPTIMKRIPAKQGSTVLFGFNRKENVFIWIDVKQVGGSNPPKPLKDYSLGKPPLGYQGKLFQISAGNGVFSVTG